jgi:outer membrane protein
MKSPIIAALLLLCLAAPALALTGIGGFTYDLSMPVGDTEDFAGRMSIRGLGMEARWFRGEHTALGFTWHWTVFHEQYDGTWEVENGHVTGHQFHRIYSSPVLFTYYYQLGNAEYGTGTLYYAGLGAGAYWIEKKLEVGTGAHQTTNWHFGFCPELGFYYGLSFNAYLNLSIKYNYALKSGDNTGQSYLSLGLGIAWVR